MNCSICNQPMKEYHGLVETGWDCINPNCGATLNKNILPGNNPFLKLPDDIEVTIVESPTPSYPGFSYEEILKSMVSNFVNTYGPNVDSGLMEVAAHMVYCYMDAMNHMMLQNDPWTAYGQGLDNLAAMSGSNLVRGIGETDEQLRHRLLHYVQISSGRKDEN